MSRFDAQRSRWFLTLALFFCFGLGACRASMPRAGEGAGGVGAVGEGDRPRAAGAGAGGQNGGAEPRPEMAGAGAVSRDIDAGVAGGDGGTSGAPLSAKFLPPGGKTLLIIGQDLEAISGYAQNVAGHAGGVTTYTNIVDGPSSSLIGLRDPINYGAGDIHAQALIEHYPNAVLSIGLYMVDATGDNLEHIASGTHDRLIDELGAFIVGTRRPVFLRIGYEFDGEWNHYDPEGYKKAFAHIVRRLRGQGVDNFASVWQSATYAGGRYRDLPLEAWYPGNDVVDWCGSSYFKYSETPHRELLTFARDHRKPVMIAEAAPQGYRLDELTFSDDGKDFVKKTSAEVWDAWFAAFFHHVHQNSDIVRAVAYINADWQVQPMWANGTQGYWGDSRIEANADIRARWLQEVSGPAWLHGSGELFQRLAR